MDVMEALLARKSTQPRLMSSDGPSADEVRQFLTAAVTAPDHGSVRPWRFVVIEGDNRTKLGQVFADALKARDPGASAEAVAKELGRPLRAPTVIAVLARIVPDHPKAPEVEQIVATACAAQNVMLAAETKGYGAIMLTGQNARDPHVKKFFDLNPTDEIVAFIYIGRPSGPVPDKPRPDPAQFIEAFGAGA